MGVINIIDDFKAFEKSANGLNSFKAMELFETMMGKHDKDVFCGKMTSEELLELKKYYEELKSKLSLLRGGRMNNKTRNHIFKKKRGRTLREQRGGVITASSIVLCIIGGAIFTWLISNETSPASDYISVRNRPRTNWD